ncbi:MAG: 5-oxoprolinase subunit PxpA, partial [Rhodococcus sp. (in: high G+C Gram-positive bacteria)]
WTLGDDEALLGVVSSANVACGFHASDPSIMRRVCAQAVEGGVMIGAQVGYRDLPGFGRRFIDIEPEALANDVIYQIGALEAFARAAGGKVAYVKPHGALYNAIVHHEEQAAAVVEAILAHDRTLPVMGIPGVFLRRAGEAGLTTVREAFADRAYTPAGELVPRRIDGAVLTDPAEVAERVLRLVRDGTVEAIDGSTVAVEAESVCVHGDSRGAVNMARQIRKILTDNQIHISPFV